MIDESESPRRALTPQDFDGHLERPLENMSTEERLEWLWQVMLFKHWADNHLEHRDKSKDTESR